MVVEINGKYYRVCTTPVRNKCGNIIPCLWDDDTNQLGYRKGNRFGTFFKPLPNNAWEYNHEKHEIVLI